MLKSVGVVLRLSVLLVLLAAALALAGCGGGDGGGGGEGEGKLAGHGVSPVAGDAGAHPDDRSRHPADRFKTTWRLFGTTPMDTPF